MGKPGGVERISKVGGAQMQLDSFRPEMQSRLDLFYETMYASRGLQYEPEGCHQDLRHIATVYQVNGGGFWILQEQEQIVGTVGPKMLDAMNGIGEVKRLAVWPDYQGKGYGRQLLNHLIESAKANSFKVLRLDTMKSSLKALKLYHGLGFSEISRYNDNWRAEVFMELQICQGRK